MDEVKDLSRRERQIMDIIYSLGEATVTQVRDGIEDPPSYSAVRALLRILEEKGHLQHRHDGPRYVFSPTMNRNRARRSALQRILKVFFDGSTEKAVSALLDLSDGDLSEEDYDRLLGLIEKARREGR
jgi:predicted transcriptional regulator